MEENKITIRNTTSGSIGTYSRLGFSITMPLQMEWQPKEDITTYELALCLPYMFRNVHSYEIDQSEEHFRHFKIINHNK